MASVAVTVPEDPKDIVVPLIVIELLVSDAFPIFESVFVDPLIDLLVNVFVLDALIACAPLVYKLVK